MRIAVAAALFLASCATPKPIDRGHNRPLSVAEHQQEADRHEQEAEKQQSLYRPEANNPNAQPLQCFDQPLAGVPTDGTEDIPLMRPCWTVDTNPTANHKRAAEAHLRAAAEHRAKAAALLGAEKQSCRGMGEQEISHSPFYHRDDILSVKPYREGHTLRGAVVLFRRVPGLTAAWMRRAIACHQARAAVMGYSRTFMSYCPLMLEGVAASVDDTPAGIRVTLRSKDDVTAAAVLGRTEDLVGGE